MRENFTTSRYRLVVAVLACALVGAVAFPAMAAAGTQTFAYTGAAQSWVVPTGVTSLTVDVYGAQGGYERPIDARVPGLGGRTQATIPVTPGETLWIHVGGAGTATAGGWNGGGNPYGSGGGGGGASDIRRGGTNLAARVVVAGGGGGTGAQYGGGGGGGSSYASSFASGVVHTQAYKWGNGFVSVAWGGDTPPEAPRPARITLSPGTQTRELDDNAQVSARVDDQFNNPMADVIVHYKLNGYSIQYSSTSSWGTTSLNYGHGNNTPHTDTVTASPEKSPTITGTATVVWSDTVAPSAPTITSGPSNLTNATSATFAFTGERGGTFQCKLDGDAFSNCTSPKSYTGLSEGSHTFKVRQTDSSGNVSPERSYTWTVDTTPPAAPTIGTKPENPSNSSNPAFTFTGEEGATFQCKLDGASLSSCTSPKTYSDVADGSHTFAVRQTDRAGNASTTAGYTWTIDTVAPPAPTITEAPEQFEQSDDARFSFTGEPGASFACRIDDHAYESCGSPKTYDDVGDGLRSFAVRQTDVAGNTSPSATHHWVVASGSGTIGADRPSEKCGPGAKKIADGFVGDTYVRLRYERVDSRTTWVCFRAAGDTANFGGRLIVIAGTVGAEPTVDDQAHACDSENDKVEGDAQQSGHFGDEDDGSYTPYLIEPEVSDDGAAFCLVVGDFAKRVILPTTGIAPPDVKPEADSPPVPSPAPADGREGYPSRTCAEGPGGTHVNAMNMDVGDDGHVWLDAWQPGTTQAFACVRLEGPIGIGGVLGVDTTGSPGIAPVVQPGTDMSACSLDVYAFDQHGLVIARSAPGGATQTLCVKQGDTVRTLTVGTSGEADTDVFTWTPDPGTPLGPIS